MALNIYKPGQGYWTRLLTALVAGIIVVFGLNWLAEVIKIDDLVIKSVTIVAIGFVVVGVLFWLMNRRRSVEFLIATDSEMRKVNWPSKREIYGSTWVVICGTILMAVLLFTVDSIFIWFFRMIGVLRA